MGRGCSSPIGLLSDLILREDVMSCVCLLETFYNIRHLGADRHLIRAKNNRQPDPDLHWYDESFRNISQTKITVHALSVIAEIK